MKRLIVTLLIALAVVVPPAFAEDAKLSYTTDLCVRDQDAAVRDLAKLGVICKVFGHWWEQDAPSYYFVSPANERRQCRLCGRVERKVQPPPQWEEVK